MARVIANIHRNLALELARGEKSVAYIAIDGGAIALMRKPKRDFDEEFYLDGSTLTDRNGPLTPRRFARVYLNAKHWTMDEPAATALLTLMALDNAEPRSSHSVVLLSDTGAFIGCYESSDDAGVVASFFPGARIIGSARQLAELPAAHFEALRKAVAPSVSNRSKTKLYEGVLEMAKAADKPATQAPAKIEKTKKERQARADGPVAKIRAYVDKNADGFRSGKLTRADARKALIEQGFEKGTVGVQLPRRLKELKIEAQRGGQVKIDKKTGAARVVTKAAKEDTPKKAKAAKKPAAAKPAAKKTAAKGGTKKPAQKKPGGKKPTKPYAEKKAAPKKAAAAAAPVPAV